MTFYILDHGPSPTISVIDCLPPGWVAVSGDRWTIWDGAGSVGVPSQSRVVGTRPTRRAAEELVELLRRQEQEKTDDR